MKKILGQPGDFQVTPFLVPLHNHVLEAEEWRVTVTLALIVMVYTALMATEQLYEYCTRVVSQIQVSMEMFLREAVVLVR